MSKYSFHNYYCNRHQTSEGIFDPIKKAWNWMSQSKPKKEKEDPTIGGQVLEKPPQLGGNQRVMTRKPGFQQQDIEDTMARMGASGNFMKALSNANYDGKQISDLTAGSSQGGGNPWVFLWQSNFWPAIKYHLDNGDENKANLLMFKGIIDMKKEHGFPDSARANKLVNQSVKQPMTVPDPSVGIDDPAGDLSGDEEEMMSRLMLSPRKRDLGGDEGWGVSPAAYKQPEEDELPSKPSEVSNWRKKPITERIKEAHKMKDSGEKISAIAKKLGVSDTTVRRYLKQNRPTSEFGAGNTWTNSDLLNRIYK
jgi:Helix-turn-helix domain of resolvase